MTELNDVDDLVDGDEEQDEDYVPGFEVSCEPLGSKAISFFAMKLVQCDQDRAVLKRIMGMTPLANAAGILGLLIGVGFVFGAMWINSGPIRYLVPLMLLVPAIGFYRMWRRCQPMTFDRRKGLCWPGASRIDPAGRDHGISIDRIDCLQTLTQYNFGGDSNNSSYELNLVLNDPPGERIHVMCHSNLRRFIDCYIDLSDFIDKPVWDGDGDGSDE